MRTDLPTSSILQCAAGVWCWPNTFAQWELGISGDVFLFDLPGLCDIPLWIRPSLGLTNVQIISIKRASSRG